MVAVRLLLPLVLVLAGCGGDDGSGSRDGGPTDAGRDARPSLDCTNAAEAVGWLAFHDGASSIEASGVPAPDDRTGCSVRLDYDVAAGDGHAGVERIYETPKDWRAYARLEVPVYAEATGHPIRFEVYDAEDERFELVVPATWTGWRALELPFADFTLADYQPPDASLDGDFELRGVRGMAVSPSVEPGTSGSLWLGAFARGGEAVDGGI